MPRKVKKRIKPGQNTETSVSVNTGSQVAETPELSEHATPPPVLPEVQDEMCLEQSTEPMEVSQPEESGTVPEEMMLKSQQPLSELKEEVQNKEEQNAEQKLEEGDACEEEERQVLLEGQDDEVPREVRAEPSQPKNLQELEFEKIINNPATHKSAWEMLIKERTLQRSVNLSNGKACHRVATPKSGSMKLRSSDPLLPEKVSVSSSVKKVAKQTASQPKSPEPMTPEEHGIADGEAMVREIISRYETNKMKVIRADLAEKKGYCRDELDLDDDDDLIWNEDVNSSNKKSDFLQYMVPQYELKDKLYKKHFEKIQSMPMTEVSKLCRQVIPELQGIMEETIYCERHDIFKSCGVSKQVLREMTIARPFTNAHDIRVIEVINDALLTHKQTLEVNGELLHYISCVLIPEALIRIYAAANVISRDLAEKELRFGAGYDGTLSEELIKTLSESSIAINKENIY